MYNQGRHWQPKRPGENNYTSAFGNRSFGESRVGLEAPSVAHKSAHTHFGYLHPASPLTPIIIVQEQGQSISLFSYLGFLPQDSIIIAPHFPAFFRGAEKSNGYLSRRPTDVPASFFEGGNRCVYELESSCALTASDLAISADKHLSNVVIGVGGKWKRGAGQHSSHTLMLRRDGVKTERNVVIGFILT